MIYKVQYSPHFTNSCTLLFYFFCLYNLALIKHRCKYDFTLPYPASILWTIKSPGYSCTYNNSLLVTLRLTPGSKNAPVALF